MENEKLYLGTNGKYYQRHELATAFFLATGCDISDFEDVNAGKRFDIWVHGLIGKSIERSVSIDEIAYEDFIKVGQKLLAVRTYRERNNSTLREAKEYIDNVEMNMKKEGVLQ